MKCVCAGVTKKEFERFVELYKDMSLKSIKEALNIGIGCGQCIRRK